MTQEPAWLTDKEQHAWLGYRRMTRLLDARLAKELTQDSGLSFPDYDVLSSLTEREDNRWCAKDLGAYLLWSPSRLSHHLDRMQQRGLIRREDCLTGRGADVVLTEAGRDAIEKAAPAHVNSVRAAFINLLDEQALLTLAKISDTVIDNLMED